MKKILSSILVGTVVVGTATALPTPGDRKKVCEQNPQKVWVEKTKACIPTNPCLPENVDTYGAYCELRWGLPKNTQKRDLVLSKYAEKVWNSSLADLRIGYLLGPDYIPLTTPDGDYRVYKCNFSDEELRDWLGDRAIAYYVLFAYGVEGDGSEIDFGTNPDDGSVSGVYYGSKAGIDENTCREMAEFASSLAGKNVEYKYASEKQICFINAGMFLGMWSI